LECKRNFCSYRTTQRTSIEKSRITFNCEWRSHNSQQKNALAHLAAIVRKALFVPKKRMKTKIPKKEKEKRLQEKKRRGDIKKERSKKFDE
jgi:ribosome-associated protein